MRFTDTSSLEYNERYFYFLRKKWQSKHVLRALYAHWFQRLVAHIPADHAVFEIGGGPGNFKEFYPTVQSSDILPLPWLDMCFNAVEGIPIRRATSKSIVLIDVYHHIADARQLFEQIDRVTQPKDRVLFLEPYVSPLSYPIYRWLHHEPVDLQDRPLGRSVPRTHFVNEAAAQCTFPTMEFRASFPSLNIIALEYMASIEYALSGGFNYPSLYPRWMVRPLARCSDWFCRYFGKWIAFRTLIVLEKQG